LLLLVDAMHHYNELATQAGKYNVEVLLLFPSTSGTKAQC